MNIIDVITNLIDSSQDKYGKNWRSRFDNIYQNYRFKPKCGQELKNFNETFLAPMNLKLVGAGKDRLVFNYKNIIIKIDHKHSCANELEFNYYNEFNKSKILKYFTCPTFQSLQINECNILLTMKAVVEENDYCDDMQDMSDVLSGVINDMFWANRGVFAGGVVAVDLGEGYMKTRIGLVEEFVEGHKKFWKDYTQKYDDLVNDFQNANQETLCIAS